MQWLCLVNKLVKTCITMISKFLSIPKYLTETVNGRCIKIFDIFLQKQCNIIQCLFKVCKIIFPALKTYSNFVAFRNFLRKQPMVNCSNFWQVPAGGKKTGTLLLILIQTVVEKWNFYQSTSIIVYFNLMP